MRFPWRLVAVLFLLGLTGGRVLAQGAPYLTHASDTAPEYTLVLTGGDFDPATVKVVVHVPGTAERLRPDLEKIATDLAQRYPGPAAPLPLTPPAAQTFTLSPYQATAHSVFVNLPKQAGGVNYPPGFVALVWLKQGDQLSNPLAINRPAAWFLLKNACRPGEMNRICGWNFKGDMYMKNYVSCGRRGAGRRCKWRKRNDIPRTASRRISARNFGCRPAWRRGITRCFCTTTPGTSTDLPRRCR